jgi:hypothetical protein
LDIKGNLSIRTIWAGVRGICDAVNGYICDLRNWLADSAEELVHVRLDPAAAEFDDGDHASARKAGRPIVGGAKVRHVPRTSGYGLRAAAPRAMGAAGVAFRS